MPDAARPLAPTHRVDPGRLGSIAAGGALGSVLRWGGGGGIGAILGTAFPWGTLAVNVVGSALLGWLSGRLLQTGASANLRAFATVGLCGGFTTFSAFDLETILLLQAGRWVPAAAYSLGSVVLCLVAVGVGFRMARRRPPG